MMKKVIALSLFLLAGFYSAQAQYDPKALEILDQVSDKYEKMGGFKASFSYTLTNEAAGANAQTEGEIVAKGKQFRLAMNGQEIISDGETVWTYQPETNEVYIDNFANVVGENVNPSNIHELYKKGFKYMYRESRTVNGKPHHVIDLVPENASQTNFFKIQLVINQADNTFDSFTVFEKNGNKYLFDITKFESQASLQDSFFRFNKAKYNGVTEVDMRDY